MNKDIRNILFIAPGGIGNLVLSIPSLRALKAQWPDAGITLLTCEAGVEKILDHEGLVTDTVCFKATPGQDLFGCLSQVRTLRAKGFDMAVSAGGVNPLSSGMVGVLSGIPIRAGQAVNGGSWLYTQRSAYASDEHELEGGLSVVQALGCPVVEKLPSLRITSEEESEARDYCARLGIAAGTRLVGIHSGVGKKMHAQRQWPLERFVRVMDALADTLGAVFVLTGGSHEQEDVRRIAALTRATAFSTAGELSLRGTAAVLKKCCLVISNDSGPAHIAAAVGTPLIVLFGPVDPVKSRARGENVAVFSKEGPDRILRITPEEVILKAMEMLS
ncbi:MAG: glycosyltransferase family 9 protein [Candidatus Omnitrophica bacterium]|nr:glycosyltransferase family 9 protein [Candidatus Omnitrophota bacterium]